MYEIKRRFTSYVIGLVANILIAVPVSADDTEIYIGLNQGATVVRPNVLFILDTSGSMDTDVTTTVPYGPSKTYSGSCNAGRIYWSTSGSPPSCSTSNWFDATKLRCQAAAAPLGSGGVGTYTDRVARWQPASGGFLFSTPAQWQTLNSTVNSPPHVECQADQGVHGDGTGGTYIKNGSGGPWQSGSSGAAAWSATGDTYTLFSGNYLNWYHDPGTTTTMSRIEIVKGVVKNLVDSNSNINIGLMRYDTKNYGGKSGNKGGPVIFPMSNIDAAGVRNNFKTTVDGLTASGWTPLAETLYEAYQYLSGKNVVYGKSPNTIASAAGCLDPANTSKYKSPLDFECQKNFIVYLTDGEPTYDGDADTDIGTLLSGATLPSGDKTCAHGTKEEPVDNCLDELAEYLHEVDLRPDLNGKQTAVTYTIGFGLDGEFLRTTAKKGGGKSFTANNYQELSSAFTQIITEIRKISDLFSAPAVSVNAYNRLYHNSDLYFPLFRPAANIHWLGNIKRFKVGPYDTDGNGTKDQYAILDANGQLAVDPKTGFFADTATSFWTPGAEAPDGGQPEKGGSVSKQPDDPATRKVFTYTGDYSASAVKDLSQPVNQLHESNSSITEAMLGLPAADPKKTSLLQWARGVDVDDEDKDGVTTDARKAMGDPMHAIPVLVSYGLSGTTEDMTLFVTSNDGYLHAIDTDDGTELFSFVPKEMLARLKTLREDPPLSGSGRSYGLDGPMTVWIKENASDTDSNIEPGEGDHVYLYFGQRRGGRNYYAMDVTDRDHPKLLWKIEGGVGDFKELGETWSAPKHTKVKIGSTEKDVLIFGGGYDPNQETATVPVDDGQGRAIYMVDAETGARLWWTGNNALSPAPDLGFAKMTNSIPANVRVIDVDRDGLADRIYAADLRGQLWRFDINNGASGSGLVSGALMAELQKTTASATPNTEADNRRFFNEPDAALIVPPGKPSFMSVSIGSGSRAHPLNKVTQDRFYVVRDPNPLRKPVNGSGANAYPSAWPLTEANLYDVTTVIKFTDEQQKALDSAHGWRINLVDISTGNFVGEKVLNKAVTFGGVVLFDTFTPVASQSASACAPATGAGRIYALNILNGNPVYNLDQVGNDQDLARADRATDLTHPGIPPDIVIYFPKPEGGLEGEPTPVVGSEILNKLKFKNPIVKTYWYRNEEGTY